MPKLNKEDILKCSREYYQGKNPALINGQELCAQYQIDPQNLGEYFQDDLELMAASLASFWDAAFQDAPPCTNHQDFRTLMAWLFDAMAHAQTLYPNCFLLNEAGLTPNQLQAGRKVLQQFLYQLSKMTKEVLLADPAVNLTRILSYGSVDELLTLTFTNLLTALKQGNSCKLYLRLVDLALT